MRPGAQGFESCREIPTAAAAAASFHPYCDPQKCSDIPELKRATPLQNFGTPLGPRRNYCDDENVIFHTGAKGPWVSVRPPVSSCVNGRF